MRAPRSPRGAPFLTPPLAYPGLFPGETRNPKPETRQAALGEARTPPGLFRAQSAPRRDPRPSPLPPGIRDSGFGIRVFSGLSRSVSQRNPKPETRQERPEARSSPLPAPARDSGFGIRNSRHFRPFPTRFPAKPEIRNPKPDRRRSAKPGLRPAFSEPRAPPGETLAPPRSRPGFRDSGFGIRAFSGLSRSVSRRNPKPETRQERPEARASPLPAPDSS